MGTLPLIFFIRLEKQAGCRWTARGHRIRKTAGTVSRVIRPGIFFIKTPRSHGRQGYFLRTEIRDSSREGFCPGDRFPMPDASRGAHAGCIPIIKKIMASRINPNWATSMNTPCKIVKKTKSITLTIAKRKRKNKPARNSNLLHFTARITAMKATSNWKIPYSIKPDPKSSGIISPVQWEVLYVR